jgi:lyso-ornithine lipid O-acyltransferase
LLAKWSTRVLDSLSVNVSFAGYPPPEGLIISNHLSYLDILVFSSITHCVFVSKREVKSWPVVGWVATLSGAVYVDRARRSDTQAVQPEMQAALSHGLRLTMFPEGTSTDGSRVLGFHSSLFQPAIDLNAPVTAAAIRYAVPDGDPSLDVCYWGDMTLVTHLFRMLAKEPIYASVQFSEQHYRFTERKEAARTMQQEVERLYATQREASLIS